MSSREDVEIKYDNQLEKIDNDILNYKKRIADLAKKRERINDQKTRELERVQESVILEKQGLDAIKSSWISKISGKGHSKEEVQKFVNDRVNELEDEYPEDYQSIVGTLKKILKNKYTNVNLGEESGGAITTGSIGSPTMTTNTGKIVPAIYGSSHIHASKMGNMLSRVGDITDNSKKKKKKKKAYREYIENHGEILS